jgi:mediator of RNA polymerase II transcription subunit 22
MKLLLLLSDEAQIAHRRDTEMKSVQAEKEEARAKAAVLLDELIMGTSQDVAALRTPPQSMEL